MTERSALEFALTHAVADALAPVAPAAPAANGPRPANRPAPAIGVDVVEIARIARARSRWGRSFDERFFTPVEIAYAAAGADPDRRFAGLFAAKEAVYKALALTWDRPFSWRWIEISHAQSGAPLVRLAPELTNAWPGLGPGGAPSDNPATPSATDTVALSLSISYAGGLAVAVAVRG